MITIPVLLIVCFFLIRFVTLRARRLNRKSESRIYRGDTFKGNGLIGGVLYGFCKKHDLHLGLIRISVLVATFFLPPLIIFYILAWLILEVEK